LPNVPTAGMLRLYGADQRPIDSPSSLFAPPTIGG
jgi:hypothetical protein